jgi:hypothetical protein
MGRVPGTVSHTARLAKQVRDAAQAIANDPTITTSAAVQGALRAELQRANVLCPGVNESAVLRELEAAVVARRTVKTGRPRKGYQRLDAEPHLERALTLLGLPARDRSARADRTL